MMDVRPEPGVTNGELVRRAADGDREAWNTLVDRHTALVWAICRSYRLQQQDAADVVQVTWLRLVENLHRIRDPEGVHAWLVTTAKREALRLVRAQKRVGFREVAEMDLAEPAPGPYECAERRDRRRIVRTAVARLPQRDQVLLTMLAASDPPSYAEVASTLDMPIGSIGPSRMRALAKLRRELDGLGSRELYAPVA